MEQQNNDNLAKLTARRKQMQRMRQEKRRRSILSALIFLLGAALVVAVLAFLIVLRVDPLVEELTVEAGSSVMAEDFLRDKDLYAGRQVYFKTNMVGIDLDKVGDYQVEVYVDGKAHSSKLCVRDRTAPKADPVEMSFPAGMLPDAQFLVTNIRDAGSVQISYAQEPDVSKGGEVYAQVLLTDQAGNTSVVKVKLNIIADETPPVINGAMDRVFYVGDPVIYLDAYMDKDGVEHPEIVATDGESTVTLKVDRDQVDSSKAGTYPVTYIATDAVGNVTTVTVQFILVDKPQDYVEPDEVYALAQKVLDQITTEDMSDMEVAFAIYRWVSTSIGYVGTSDKTSWTGAAYQAFTQYYGDCYNYFAAAKALYHVAGIKNVDVIKSDTSHSSHYWSLIDLGDGWYHVDCTPRSVPGQFFMNTDAELEAYSVQNRNSHIFDGSLYPARATVSVQDKVDYANGKIKE